MTERNRDQTEQALRNRARALEVLLEDIVRESTAPGHGSTATAKLSDDTLTRIRRAIVPSRSLLAAHAFAFNATDVAGHPDRDRCRECGGFRDDTQHKTNV